MMNAKSIMKFVGMILLVMIGIFAVKKLTQKFNIPVVSALAQEV